jgi:hypothetical protein
MADTIDRSASSLLGDLVSQVTELFRKEIMLLRAELGEKATQAVTACGLIVAAVVLALTALNVLAAALVVALENLGIPGGWAALVVGVILAAIAWALASKGISALKASNLAPERAARAASRDAALVKGKM